MSDQDLEFEVDQLLTTEELEAISAADVSGEYFEGNSLEDCFHGFEAEYGVLPASIQDGWVFIQTRDRCRLYTDL